ncbi:hypothetical protein [Nocardioides marmoriginsengisoli]|uniref:hypothetical protein n=1 Tax=Nocardioides marmoriginsengisoli TaxID=661483 RepID=UPI0011CE4D94|nr:hypothetical protein [Nocardioides marmoriginsengisoli]
MKNQNMNQSWQTVTRSISIVPVHGFGMGDVCPETVGFHAGTSTLKRRHAAAVKATPVMGRQPWSPPVT